MSDAMKRTFTPADQPARDRIEHDLAVNMLVEAGAGSGKTTSLVGRMLQHVRQGTPVDRIAAVTFTRKAANELQERFRNELEACIARETEAAAAERFARALHTLDRAFLGTIHSFCGRILREHPLEAGLDPTFREVSGEEMETMQRAFWRRWVDREERLENADLAAVRALAIDPAILYEGFTAVRTYPDVAFVAEARPMPDVSRCRRALVHLLEEAASLRPAEEPADGWDDLMTLTRRLETSRRVRDWNDPVVFCTVAETITKSNCKITQKRWGADKLTKDRAKDLCATFEMLVEDDLATLVREWREHRYPAVMRVLQAAAAEFERERHATGQLGFEDLLLLTARLLREHPGVRDLLGARYAHLLVDEFQDTDPMQAEVCLLLASPSSEGSEWTRVVPRPGSLFVVGDPKQSIYRFRRADIGVYEFVKGRIAAHGVVLELTSNFRSTRQVGSLVNAHFDGPFGPAATREQAAFTPMRTVKEHDDAAVSLYSLAFDSARPNKYHVMRSDAETVASLVAGRIARGAAPADFLILTRAKEPVAYYARALAARNVPATTTGAALPQERELQELLVVLRALADPENSVAVVAALEGLFFGLSPADLWTGKQAGVRFAITARPSDVECRAGEALVRLHDWWSISQRQPVDVLLERILDDTGLLFHATSQELGDARAGSLLHIVETLRAASTDGVSSIRAAIERLDALFAEAADDVSLRPGRGDAVRIMNVHQAKGLEAPVVILAAPLDLPDFPPDRHIRRDDDGAATGGIVIRGSVGIIAQPVRWAEMEAAESRYEEAEAARLLYVAATRAERELVVSQCEKRGVKETKPDASMWRPLESALGSQGARRLEIELMPAVARRTVERTSASIQTDVATAQGLVAAARKASYTVQTVSGSAKVAAEDAVPFVLRPGVKGRGKQWGTAVHALLETWLRGRRGASLLAFARATANDQRLLPDLAEELCTMASRLDDGSWVPVRGDAVMPELSVMHWRAREGTPGVLTEGVIDAAVRRDGRWEVIDWKTDAVDEAEWEVRSRKYARQVEAYGSMLAELTGDSVTTRIERIR